MKIGWKILFIFLSLVILALIVVSGIFVYFVYTGADNIEDITNSTDICNLSNDNYTLPDFSNIRNLLENEEMIKDIPNEGCISLRFYHYFNDCKIYDKSYYLTKNKVEEKTEKADIEIFIPTDFASEIQGNLCSSSKKAKESGNFQTNLNIGIPKLFWKYSGMLKYRECLGV